MKNLEIALNIELRRVLRYLRKLDKMNFRKSMTKDVQKDFCELIFSKVKFIWFSENQLFHGSSEDEITSVNSEGHVMHRIIQKIKETKNNSEIRESKGIAKDDDRKQTIKRKFWELQQVMNKVSVNSSSYEVACELLELNLKLLVI